MVHVGWTIPQPVAFLLSHIRLKVLAKIVSTYSKGLVDREQYFDNNFWKISSIFLKYLKQFSSLMYFQSFFMILNLSFVPLGNTNTVHFQDISMSFFLIAINEKELTNEPLLNELFVLKKLWYMWVGPYQHPQPSRQFGPQDQYNPSLTQYFESIFSSFLLKV